MKDFIRILIARVMSVLLAARSRPWPINPGPCLVIAPHADDETLGCGGLIAAKVARGDSVDVAFITDSSGSHPGHPTLTRQKLATRRRQEACAALAELGLAQQRTHFLEAPDGRLDRLTQAEAGDLQGRLAALLASVRPTEVYLPFLGGGSSEHDAAHRLCVAALRAGGFSALVCEYPVWAWWNPLRLRHQLLRPAENFRHALGPLRARKRRALACHRSQGAAISPDSAPALPPVLARLCTGPREFFFLRRS